MRTAIKELSAYSWMPVINDYIKECNNILTENEFENLYDKAIKDNPHGALIIDLTRSKKRFYNNLEKELII